MDDVLAGNRNKMAALKNALDKVFVRRFLFEEYNSYEVYEDLLVVIKNRYPNLRGCSLQSVKRFCTNHGIKKRMSVPDRTESISQYKVAYRR